MRPGAVGVDRQDECRLVKPFRNQVPYLACKGAVEAADVQGFQSVDRKGCQGQCSARATLQKVVVGEDAFPKP